MMKKLLKGILLPSILLLFSYCRIYDESSNVVVTSPGTLSLTVSNVSFDEIETGDTTTITAKLVSIQENDTTAISNGKISVSCADPLADLSKSTIVTGEAGLAAVSFTSTLPEEVTKRQFAIVFTQGDLSDTAYVLVTKEKTIDKSSNLKLNAYPMVIDADRGQSSSIITVSIVDDNNLPIVGETIQFSATAGKLIPDNNSVTDTKGEVTATLYSEELNTTAYVTATLTSDQEKTADIPITFKGVTITSTLSKQSIIPNGNDTLIITSILKNAAEETIGNVPISFEALSTDLTITFNNDTTSTSGEAICKVVGSNNNLADTISVSAGGVEERIEINYSSNSISLIKDGLGNSFVANGMDTTTLQIKYVMSNLVTPISNTPITVSISSGNLIDGTDFKSNISTTTNTSGIATIYVKNPEFSGTATLNIASSYNGEKISLTEDIQFIADKLYRLKLSGTPEVITTGGDIAEITATAYDSLGNLVAGDSIAFQLLKSPGGNERIVPAVAVTNNNGQAKVKFISGDVASNQHDVELTARTFGGINSENNLFFTISDPVSFINISSNISKITEDANGGYGIKLLSIVSDINSNPVVDGTPVKFSARKSGYAIWRQGYLMTSDYVFILRPYAQILPFDDINDNFIKDSGEGNGISYPLYRGEDIVWGDEDRAFNPGPAFIDINCNGRRDYNNTYSTFEKPEPYWHEDAFPQSPAGTIRKMIVESTDGFSADIAVGDVVYYIDYNYNGVLDLAEPTYDPNMTDEMYESHPDYPGYNPLGQYPGWYEDIDWNNNGKAEPNMTALSVKGEVLTENGKAPNELHYGQDDGNRLCVEIWAESKGVRTENSVQYSPLPITEDAEEYFDPFKGKTLK